MNTRLIEPAVPAQPRWRNLGRQLDRDHVLYVPGVTLADELGVSVDDVHRFGDFWNRLTRDRHMADGGTYRYRRYGQFERMPAGALRQLPHGAYEQPRYINSLNGGVARTFDPLEPGFCTHAVLLGLIDWLTALYDQREGRACQWNVRLHPYRIVASDDKQGCPTPEGLHRDGVDYIVSLLLCRHNVSGGETTVTDEAGHVLLLRTLLQPLDIVLGDDQQTLHSVSPIVPLVRGETAWRDVLVVAFTRVNP